MGKFESCHILCLEKPYLSQRINVSNIHIILSINIQIYIACQLKRGCLGRDHIIVGFTTTYAISAFHH